MDENLWRHFKRDCRKPKERLQENRKEIAKNKTLCRYNSEIYKARWSFFSNTINARVFFSVFEKLRNPPLELAPELATTTKCNELHPFLRARLTKSDRILHSSPKKATSNLLK